VKILLIKPSALGDIVQALPVLTGLDLRRGKIILPT
jgi:ADP-heptose:LPS heptosyltransferase